MNEKKWINIRYKMDAQMKGMHNICYKMDEWVNKYEWTAEFENMKWFITHSKLSTSKFFS